jgi:hypothetical protein
VPTDETRCTASQAFRFQSAICRGQEAELCAGLLERCAEDVDAGGAVASLVQEWAGDPLRDFVPLRLMAGVHHLVLAGLLPELARHFPTAGGSPVWPEAWERFRDAVRQHEPELRRWLEYVPQTNEVGRSSTLLGGFHAITREHGLPLRIRELGASAGLNLLWDRYHYELGGVRWGDEQSAVRLRSDWSGPPPALVEHVEVESRRGCDISPIRITEPEARERLEAYVWPDQPDRLTRLRSAISMALEAPPAIEAGAASDWLAGALEQQPSGVTTVIYHSAFWPYLSETEQSTISELMHEAGTHASSEAPLAWLRLEDGRSHPELWLRLWPGGEDIQLAEAQNHGRWIRWLDPPLGS